MCGGEMQYEWYSGYSNLLAHVTTFGSLMLEKNELCKFSAHFITAELLRLTLCDVMEANLDVVSTDLLR